MNLLRRIKNLWELSGYRYKEIKEGGNLVRDLPPEKRMAKIVNVPKDDLFEDITENDYPDK